MSDVSRILSQLEGGADPSAAEQLLPLVYDELRRLAAVQLANERPGQTLQPTALVHEAYLRLVGGTPENVPPEGAPNVRWDSRRHFFAAAAESMRRILIETARRKKAVKHGGQFTRIELDPELPGPDTNPHDNLEAIDAAVSRLANHHPAIADLVKLHLYAGLSIPEVAELLGIPRSTAYTNWSYARAWLQAWIDNTW